MPIKKYTAGYSGTPLIKKLGPKDGMRALLIAIPPEVIQLAAFSGWGRVKSTKTPRGISGGPYDYVHYFTADEKALASALPKIKYVMAQTGMTWISWPKKTSGVSSTVSEDTIRNLALKIGLVDVKVCAVNEVWSGLKLMIRLKDRT